MSSDIPKTTTTKDISNLPIEVSVRFAEGEVVREQTKKFIQQFRGGPTVVETLETTPSKADEIVGSTAQRRFSTLPDTPKFLTKKTAFTGGRGAASIGEGDKFIKNIESAPLELKAEKENYAKLLNLANQYHEIDGNCSFIEGRTNQFNKG